MARVAFTSLMEEIVGKLAGSVFQDSYFGNQIRTRVSPRNPQTYYQQLRRGMFGYISANWRFLTTIERNSFISAAGSIPAALNLFVEANVNLSLLNLPPITFYTPSTTPVLFPIAISNFTAPLLEIVADSSLTIVPAGTNLLIFATSEKEPPKNFTNPSMYSPVVSYLAGSNLSTPLDISADWISRYGQFTSAKRICVKSVLIDTSNGNRGADSFSCAISPFIAVNNIINANGDKLINSNGDFLISP